MTRYAYAPEREDADDPPGPRRKPFVATDCPHHPRKRQYSSEHQAERAIETRVGIDRDVRPYRCKGCGLWHLTSRPPDWKRPGR